MVKISGNVIWRDGQKIGTIDGHHIRAHDDQKLGYFEGNFVYNEMGHKVAYVEGDHLYSSGSGEKTSLEKVNEEVQGGVLSEAGKCAVYVLLD